MKLKRIFFIAAVVALLASACLNSTPAPALNTIPLMAVLGNINPLQPMLTAYFSPPAADCDSSTYIKDVTIIDGMKFKPGTAFIKKWKIKNTGSCGWNKKYSLQFADGDRMSGKTTHLTKWVPPDETIVVTVDMVAPETEGVYTGYWILTDSNGTAFGNYVTVKIIVSNKKP